MDKYYLLTYWDTEYHLLTYSWFETEEELKKYIKKNKIKKEFISDCLKITSCEEIKL